MLLMKISCGHSFWFFLNYQTCFFRHSVACFLTRGDLWVSWEEGQAVFEELLLGQLISEENLVSSNLQKKTEPNFEEFLS